MNLQVSPANHYSIQDSIDKMRKSSAEFYKEEVKGKKLDELKLLAEGAKLSMYGSLKSLVVTRKPGQPPNLMLLLDVLESLRNLRLIYSKIEEQGNRPVIKAIRKIGAHPAITALFTFFTIACAAYLGAVYGIEDLIQKFYIRLPLAISGIAVLFFSLGVAYGAQKLKEKYEKVRISPQDIKDKILFTSYFRLYGLMKYDQCILLIDNLKYRDKIRVPYNREKIYDPNILLFGLKNLAIDSKFYQDHPQHKHFVKKIRHLPHSPEKKKKKEKISSKVHKVTCLNSKMKDFPISTIVFKEKPNLNPLNLQFNANLDTNTDEASSYPDTESDREEYEMDQGVHSNVPQLTSQLSFNYADSDDECVEYEKKLDSKKNLIVEIEP